MSLLQENSFDLPAIGKQASSQKYTAAAYSFGSSTRERQHKKVFISHEHEKHKGHSFSPGPVYNVPTTLGEGSRFGFGTASQRTTGKARYPDSSVDLTAASVDSQGVKFPGTKTVLFGTDTKDNMKNAVILKAHPQCNMGIFSPGPTAYMPDADIITKSSPRVSFGAKTKILSAETQTPRNVGPGSYPPTESLGRQSQSQKKSNAVWSFAQEKRMPPLKPSDTVVDPSPNLSSFGKQVASKQASSPGYGFGTSTREHKAKTFLVQTKNDRGPISNWAKPSMPHPKLTIERELLKII